MSERLWPLRSLAQLAGRRRDAVSPETLAEVAPIVDAVRTGGEAALRECAQRFGDLQPGAQLFHDRAELDQALARLPTHERARLERVAERIQLFAEAQRAALCPVTVPVPGGVAEHRITPVERAGCYAPGGRYALPSSVLMTAVTARVAGVRDVWVASPKPQALSLAPPPNPGADRVLAPGGGQGNPAPPHRRGPAPPPGRVRGPGAPAGA